MKKLVLFFLLGLLVTGCGTSVPAADSAEEDPDAVVFSTTDMEGNVWDESVFADHSVTMLNFWEPWCGPCVRELPELQRLSEEYADRGLQVLGIYQTSEMGREAALVLESAGVAYPVLHYTDAFNRFQTGYVPTTVFIDSQGHVIGEGYEAFYVGSNSYDGWAAVVEGLL